jgi:hypothetical protein
VSVPNSIAVILVSFVALASPSCVLSDGTDLEDSAWEDTASEELSEDAVLAREADGALKSSTAYVPDSATPYSCTHSYCVYGLNGDSSRSFYDCFQTRAEADAYKDSHVGWKVVAGFDTRNGLNVPLPIPPECNGTTGNVRFLIRNGSECTATRKYEIASLVAPEFGTMNDTFTNVCVNHHSGCNRVRVWEHVNFDGYSLACTDDCCPLYVPPLDLSQRISSWRAKDQ